MKTAKSCNALIAMNTNTSSEYVKKRKNMIYMQHSVMMIRYVVFEMYQQDTNMLTAIKIIQHESQNITRKKACRKNSNNLHLIFQIIQN